MRPEIPYPKEDLDDLEVRLLNKAPVLSEAPVLYQHAYQLLENGEKEQAAFLLQQAVDLNQDHAPSMYELAWIHLDKNEEAKALLLFQQAAELNFAPAIFHLGLHYLIIAEKSRSESATTEAINLLQKAADLSHAPAMYELALIHLRRGNVYPALPLLEKAAELNYAPAIFHLGLHHHRRKTKEEEAKAVAFFQQAATLNYAPAMYELARIHLGKKQEDLALPLLEEAAKLNHDEAMLELAEIFAKRENPLWDFRAIFWCIQYCRESSIDEDDILRSDPFFTIDPRFKVLASLLLQRPIDQEALFSFIETVSSTEEEDLLQVKEELLSELMEETRNTEEAVTVRKARLSQRIEEALIKGDPLLKEAMRSKLTEERLLKEAMLLQLIEEIRNGKYSFSDNELTKNAKLSLLAKLFSSMQSTISEKSYNELMSIILNDLEFPTPDSDATTIAQYRLIEPFLNPTLVKNKKLNDKNQSLLGTKIKSYNGSDEKPEAEALPEALQLALTRARWAIINRPLYGFFSGLWKACCGSSKNQERKTSHTAHP